MTLSATSLLRLEDVHPELKRRILKLDSLIPEVNIQVTQGLRTWADQNELYDMGRTAPGNIVTNVKGGYSAHNMGYACDVVPEEITPGQPDWNVSHPAWQKILAIAPSCQLAEGAKWRTFPDSPHLYLEELPAEPTDQMRLIYSENLMGPNPLLVVWEQAFYGVSPNT